MLINEDILHIKNLEVAFGRKKILQNVSFAMKRNKILALIGESGSGKTVCVRSILRLFPEAKINGEIWFESDNLVNLSEKEIIKIRGKKIAMIFQNPTSSLNPVISIGKQMTEVIKFHQNIVDSEAKVVALDLLNKMKINEPEDVFNLYPHQLSGGMNQRVIIAIALSCKPQILIADEPTSSLDTINQKIIIDIFKELKDLNTISIIFVTHNIDLVKHLADDISIMKSGSIIERGTAKKIFQSPQHEYTKKLIQSTI